jgi:23S rRNA pseudouridine1911/1915/1917 synthase
MSSELIKIESHQVPKLKNRFRLSDYTPGKFNSIFSKKGIKKAIKKGFITINGEIGYTADYINGGELLELYQAKNPKKRPSITISLQIIYEDDFLAIINKPAGILVSGNKKYTLENALTTSLTKSKQKDALLYPEPIHRLDYPTSGALLIGKTSQAVILLNKMFEQQQIKKKYRAITIGNQEENGIIEDPINEKPSKSEFKIIMSIPSRKYGFLNLVELIPHTGRTHQLRIHMSTIENPILGDLKYGKEGLISMGNGLYLQSSHIRFIHPFTNNEVKTAIPLPKKFSKIFPNI